jgi:hypothetical protein
MDVTISAPSKGQAPPDVKTNEHGDGGRPLAAENFCFNGA